VGGAAKEEKYRKILTSLGAAKIIDDLDAPFDIYVTDDSSKLIRNSKLLLAIARGVKIVSTRWIEESHK
jgi:hypothetical protein